MSEIAFPISGVLCSELGLASLGKIQLERPAPRERRERPGRLLRCAPRYLPQFRMQWIFIAADEAAVVACVHVKEPSASSASTIG